MQYLVRTEQAVDGLAKVNFIHYLPDTLTDEEKATGYLVDAFSDPVSVFGKRPVLFYEVETGKIVVKYENLPATDQQELLDNMIIDSLTTQSQIDDLIAGSLI